MKKWIKNNKGILIMGALFAAGSILTAVLVNTVPNYILKTIDINALNPFETNYEMHGQAGHACATTYTFTAIPGGKSERGGKPHIFYTWNLSEEEDDNKVPNWMTITPVFNNDKGTASARVSWTEKCVVSTFDMWIEASHLDVTGTYFHMIKVIIS